jgi:hypothetical protein
MDQKSLLKELFFCLFLLLILSNTNLALGEGIVRNTNFSDREKYHYHAVPSGEKIDQPKEFIEIELFGSSGGLEYMEKVSSSESIETISIKMNKEGRFISGLRHVSNQQNERVSEERIWTDEKRVYVKRDLERTSRLKQIDIPTGKTVAVNGSLLILLRSFPFKADEKWNILMVDFSGYSIPVAVRQSGIENIIVPAGKFECYRMQVVVGLPIIKPTLIYWLTTDKPHFLVKNIGKRGPFTSAYVTYLVSKE